MSITISDFKTRLQSKIHGQSLNKVQDVDNLIFEGAGNVLLEIDPVETKRKALLSTPIYTDIYRYQAPTDLKGDKVVDLYPTANRKSSDNFSQTNTEEFGKYKTNNTFSVEDEDASKYIRVSKTINTPKTIHTMDSITSNGTWAVGGDATNLTTDTLFKVAGSSSLNFDLDGNNTTGYIENSTFTAVDLSNEEDVGALFIEVYLPNASLITSLDLRWGDDTSNYWNRTVTTQHDGDAFRNGWNILRFDWDGATQTGSPTASSVNYARLTVTYDGTAETDIRVDNFLAHTGEIYEAVYYSKYLFKNTAGTWIEKPTADSDTIVLDTDAINVLLYEVAELVAQEQQGEDGSLDINYFRAKKQEVWDKYKRVYKSQAIKRQIPYYRIRPRRLR